MSLFEIKVDDDIFRIPEELTNLTAEITSAYDNMKNIEELLQSEEVFQGRAREEILLFVHHYSRALEALVTYYSYASQYTTNAYTMMLEADEELQKKFAAGIQDLVNRD